MAGVSAISIETAIEYGPKVWNEVYDLYNEFKMLDKDANEQIDDDIIDEKKKSLPTHCKREEYYDP